MNKILSIIELIGAVPGIFFALIFTFRKSQGNANRFLGLGLLSYSLILLVVYLGRVDVFEYSKSLHVIANTGISIAWPLFYLYIGLVTFEITDLSRKHLVHAAPFAVYLITFMLPVLIKGESPMVLFILSSLFSLIISISYTLRIVVFLQRFIKRSNNYFAENDAVKVLWLKTTVILWLVVIALQTIFIPFKEMIEAFFPIAGAIHAVLINFTSVAWIYAFAYFAITHSDIFERSKKVAYAFESKDEKKAYKISDNYEELMEKRLNNAIEKDKPYLNEQLTMPELADSIKVPGYLLSRYINKAYGKNFVTFINDLRIEVVKEKLKDQKMKNVSILEIAFQSGFRTKSAFNSYFKKSVGMTPSDYRRTSD